MIKYIKINNIKWIKRGRGEFRVWRIWWDLVGEFNPFSKRPRVSIRHFKRKTWKGRQEFFLYIFSISFLSSDIFIYYFLSFFFFMTIEAKSKGLRCRESKIIKRIIFFWIYIHKKIFFFLNKTEKTLWIWHHNFFRHLHNTYWWCWMVCWWRDEKGKGKILQ